jgi:hypothetical protein
LANAYNKKEVAMGIFANNEARDKVIMEMYKNDEKKIELLTRHDNSLYGDTGLCSRLGRVESANKQLETTLTDHKKCSASTTQIVIQIVTILIAIAGVAIALLT